MADRKELPLAASLHRCLCISIILDSFSRSLQLHGFSASRGFVNSRNDCQISETFFSRRKRLFVLHYAIGHVVHLGGEMIHLGKIFLFDGVFALYPHAQAAVPSCRVQAEASFGTHHAKVALMKIPVARRAVRENTAWEPQLKIDVLFNFLKAWI